MQILKGHVSPETAYVVEDYPYGFNLRCKIRYWLDYAPKKGGRLVTQTSNPKKGHTWNKPKMSTYARFGACMFLDENNHVQWSGLSEYSDGLQCATWRQTYGEGCPPGMKEAMEAWVKAKVTFDEKRAGGASMVDAAGAAYVAYVKKED